MPWFAMRTETEAVGRARVGQVQGVADRSDTLAIPPHAPPDANDNPSLIPPKRHWSPARPMTKTGPGHPTEITTNNACCCPLTHLIEKMQLRKFAEPSFFCLLRGGMKNGQNCSSVHRGKIKKLRIGFCAECVWDKILRCSLDPGHIHAQGAMEVFFVGSSLPLLQRPLLIRVLVNPGASHANHGLPQRSICF